MRSAERTQRPKAARRTCRPDRRSSRSPRRSGSADPRSTGSAPAARGIPAEAISPGGPGTALSRTSRARGSGSPPAVWISPCRDAAGQSASRTLAGAWRPTATSAPWLQYPGASACMLPDALAEVQGYAVQPAFDFDRRAAHGQTSRLKRLDPGARRRGRGPAGGPVESHTDRQRNRLRAADGESGGEKYSPTEHGPPRNEANVRCGLPGSQGPISRRARPS